MRKFKICDYCEHLRCCGPGLFFPRKPVPPKMCFRCKLNERAEAWNYRKKFKKQIVPDDCPYILEQIIR